MRYLDICHHATRPLQSSVPNHSGPSCERYDEAQNTFGTSFRGVRCGRWCAIDVHSHNATRNAQQRRNKHQRGIVLRELRQHRATASTRRRTGSFQPPEHSRISDSHFPQESFALRYPIDVRAHIGNGAVPCDRDNRLRGRSGCVPPAHQEIAVAFLLARTARILSRRG